MSWAYQEIERDWLAGSPVAVGSSEIVAAFDRCERILGRDWINSAAEGPNGWMTGAAPTLAVVFMGQRLASLDGVVNSQQLIDKVRGREPYALAELSAIHLLRSGGGGRVELEPLISHGNRRCDFRIQREPGPWVYVEVTAPDTSEAEEQVQTIMQSICGEVISIKKAFSLEVFFRREPSDDELGEVLTAAVSFCSAERPVGANSKEELPKDLGLLILSQQQAGQVVINDHGEAAVPRLGRSQFVVGNGEPNRHVVVRMPYADQRAERIITTEARQLATDAPGLIIIDMGRVPGGFSVWEGIIQRRFQPAMHTRVGGVCLFSSGLILTGTGMARRAQQKLIVNPHPKIPLPSWINEAIDLTGPSSG
jgi:hypothetical protein